MSGQNSCTLVQTWLVRQQLELKGLDEYKLTEGESENMMGHVLLCVECCRYHLGIRSLGSEDLKRILGPSSPLSPTEALASIAQRQIRLVP